MKLLSVILFGLVCLAAKQTKRNNNNNKHFGSKSRTKRKGNNIYSKYSGSNKRDKLVKSYDQVISPKEFSTMKNGQKHLMFDKWKHDRHKKYDKQSENHAYKAFVANWKNVVDKNSQQHDVVYKLNKFADMTREEFIQQRCGLRNVSPKRHLVESVEMFQKSGTERKLTADTINWVEENDPQIVGEVRDQGQCGSCWAFATTGSIESWEAIKKSQTVKNYSEQQLVDCSSSSGNNGCGGGLMTQGFDYFVKNDICLEQNYPYKAKDGGHCKESKCTNTFRISGWTDITKGDTDALKAALNKQPVAAAVDAGVNWQLYSEGILSKCGKHLDHAVLVVGYTKDYWLVQNTWGSDWGDKGYIKLAMGNTCGIADQASYPK